MLGCAGGEAIGIEPKPGRGPNGEVAATGAEA